MLKRSFLFAVVFFIMLCTALQPLAGLAQVQGGNGLPPAPAFGNRVVLYSGVKYTGRAKSFNLGTFGPAALGFPLLNNVSSIQLPPGWYLNATARDGRRYTFTQSNAMLSNVGWDNVLCRATLAGAIQATAGAIRVATAVVRGVIPAR